MVLREIEEIREKSVLMYYVECLENMNHSFLVIRKRRELVVVEGHLQSTTLFMPNFDTFSFSLFYYNNNINNKIKGNSDCIKVL